MGENNDQENHHVINGPSKMAEKEAEGTETQARGKGAQQFPEGTRNAPAEAPGGTAEPFIETGTGTTATAKDSADKTTEIMNENIQRVQERGENLEDLSKQTETTANAAKKFAENARKVREGKASKNKGWFESLFK
jgi:hypothetical protein